MAEISAISVMDVLDGTRTTKPAPAKKAITKPEPGALLVHLKRAHNPLLEKPAPVNLIPSLEKEGITLEQAIRIIGKKRDFGVYWKKGKFLSMYTEHVKQSNGSYMGFTQVNPAALDEILEALHEKQDERLDRRLTFLDDLADFLKDFYKETKGFIRFFGLLGVAYLGLRFLREPDKQFLEKTHDGYKNQRAVVAASMLEQDEDYCKAFVGTTPDLASRVSAETGVSEGVLRAMAAYGSSDDSSYLRDKGYAGLIPVDPFAAGVKAELLERDDYLSMLSFAEIFRQIRNRVCDDETSLGIYLTSEEDVIKAKKKAKDITSDLEYIDECENACQKKIKRLSRLIAIEGCVVDGTEPGENLFGPLVVDGEVIESRKELKEFYERCKEYHERDPEHTKNHLEFNRFWLNGHSHYQHREAYRKREEFERLSVWFMNLPDYAARTIARVVE